MNETNPEKTELGRKGKVVIRHDLVVDTFCIVKIINADLQFQDGSTVR